MSKKKICFVAQFPPPMHGLSKAVETLYRSELNSIYDFERINITNNKKFPSNLMKLLRSNADLFYFTISQTKGGNLRDLVIFKLLELRHKKCLIHLHGGYYRKMVDNDLPGWQKRANYRALGKLTGGIVLSDSLKPIFQGMLPEDRIHVVKNCVDTEFLPAEKELVKKFQNPDEVLHILYLSNFIREKGYPIVLEMARLEKERIDKGIPQRYHFDFAGKFFEDNEREYFKRYVEEYDLGEVITYHGIVGGEKKINLLQKCSIFALPTRYPNEGQPISILEAMGNGMLILTTDHAGIPDIVADGIQGIVAKKNETSAQMYLNRLDGLTSEKIAQIGLSNARYCREMFGEQKYLDGMRNCFAIVGYSDR